MAIEVLFENDALIAINKPHGLLVHKSRIAKDAKVFALQQVRNYLGAHVYPAHRLDRKTSGVLVFAKSETANKALQKLFRERKVSKTYIALVRGYSQPTGVINYALSEDDAKSKEALTVYETLEQFEIALPFGKHQTSRYSLVKLVPITGRFHQLRKHMAHIFHPIIGDRPHGCNKQNKLWKEQFNMDKMYLHATKLELPISTNKTLTIEAPMSSAFQAALQLIKQENILS